MTTLPPPDLSEVMHEVVDSLRDLHDDAEHLRTEMGAYRAAFEAVDKRSWRIAAIGMFAALLLAVGLTVAIVTSRGNSRVIDTIRDCTQPGGQCFEDSQTRTAAQVERLIEAICDGQPPAQRSPACIPAEPTATR